MTELTDIHRDENGSQADTIAPPALKRAWSAGRAAFGSGWRPSRVALAPGRLELLGNHIDYNGGPVLAAVIDRFVVVAVEHGETVGLASGDIQVVMADLPTRDTTEIDPNTLDEWRNA